MTAAAPMLHILMGLAPIPPAPADRRRILPLQTAREGERFSVTGFGDKVFELLRDTGPASEREIADYFGATLPLAKRTVATLERDGRAEPFQCVGGTGTVRKLWRST